MVSQNIISNQLDEIRKMNISLSTEWVIKEISDSKEPVPYFYIEFANLKFRISKQSFKSILKQMKELKLVDVDLDWGTQWL